MAVKLIRSSSDDDPKLAVSGRRDSCGFLVPRIVHTIGDAVPSAEILPW